MSKVSIVEKDKLKRLRITPKLNLLIIKIRQRINATK